MPLSDLAREILLFEKVIHNCEEDFVHAFIYQASKNLSFNVELRKKSVNLELGKKCHFHKRKLPSQHPLLWILTSVILSKKG